ncbi:MAG: hypothetical protein HYW25_01725 [Candidatus Aenigmarchaeota archaeon]|nr:hypothetical protein [Candidatus Aenigmarchaeota archaeon]
MKEEIAVKKSSLVIIASVILVVVVASTFIFLPKPHIETEAHSSDTLTAKFALLSKAGTNFCAGPDILERVQGDRLQGACCSAMDFHRYAEQVEGLKKYSHIDKIPPDPYDIPRSLAEELLDYQKTIQLTPEQQAVYDEAMQMSHEGGPCCCKCWRWYAFEGQAKYLITEYNFDSEQIAEVWDLEDGCGGSGHEGHGDGHAEREEFEPQN